LEKELAAFKERLEQIADAHPAGPERGEKELAALNEELQRIDQKYGDSPSAEDTELRNKEIDALGKVMFQHIDEEERDQTRGKSDICPVHHVKMKAKEVPVRLAGELYYLPGLMEARKETFPYGWEWYAEGGCAPSGIKTAKVYVCPKCVEAWKKWEAGLRKGAADEKAAAQRGK
jgi:hypothetical protein